MPNILRRVAGANAATLGATLAGLSHGDMSYLARQVVRNRRSAQSAALAEFSRLVALVWANAQYDIAVNGEAWVLNRLGSLGMATIFDVGANIGEWSRAAAEAHPRAAIHAFEIMNATYAKLKQRTGDLGSRVVANQFGLSDRDGTVKVFYAENSDVHTSTFEEAHRIVGNEAYVSAEMPVTSGDAYMAKTGLRRIDILKIDVEGADWQVLMGFAQALDRGDIDVIQFEYGKCTLLARRYLRDFYDYLEPRGYVLGKLMPDHVDFKPYGIADEDFIGPNFIACRRQRADIIELLGDTPMSASASGVPKGEFALSPAGLLRAEGN